MMAPPPQRRRRRPRIRRYAAYLILALVVPPLSRRSSSFSSRLLTDAFALEAPTTTPPPVVVAVRRSSPFVRVVEGRDGDYSSRSPLQPRRVKVTRILGRPTSQPIRRPNSSNALFSTRGGGDSNDGEHATNKCGNNNNVPPSSIFRTKLTHTPHNGSRGEVVGSTGRLGSHLLSSGRGLLGATPRGVSPGSLSPPGAPIYVAVPSSSVSAVIESTLPERRGDLVLVTNGLPSRWAMRADLDGSMPTFAIPHYGVLTVGGNAVTSPTSPPTVVYGKHSRSLVKLLSESGISVREVDSLGEVEGAAVRKLIWSSVLWLLCHDRVGNKEEEEKDGQPSRQPLTVEEVHRTKSDQLRSVVEELVPVAERLLVAADNSSYGSATTTSSSIGTADEVINYMTRYSISMPKAVPNKMLAIGEIEGRNGAFLSLGGEIPQPLHEELVRRVAGEGALRRCLEMGTAVQQQSPDIDDDGPSQASSPPSSSVRTVPHSSCAGLAFLVKNDGDGGGADLAPQQQRQKRPRPIKKAVVIGAGVIGSSVALGLSRRGVDVTVFDRRPLMTQTATTTTIAAATTTMTTDYPGEATSASWAWINANGKSPPSYFALNYLGMTVWRRDGAVADLPVWCGSLVRRRRAADGHGHGGMDPTQGGAYCAYGPLDRDDVLRLDPSAEFDGAAAAAESAATPRNRDDGGDPEEVYYFPDEGHVDPASAVRALRRAASNLGARFTGGIDITDVSYDSEGLTGTVTYSSTQVSATDSSNTTDGDGPEKERATTTTTRERTVDADVIIVAGGVGSSRPGLGGLPMVNQPGAVAFADPDLDKHGRGDGDGAGRQQKPALDRILVDTINESHILSRTGGSLVVGGGYLQVGGIAATGTLAAADKDDDSAEIGMRLLAAAACVAPRAMDGATLSCTKRADRPIPADGYPAVGFIRPGLYTVVTHSGITLGPLLGDLVAGEIVDGVRYDILEDYRPTRFNF